MANTGLVSEIPTLEGEAAEAAAHRGSHLQIIASAGSGKTEVVSQRVADLIAEGVSPASIVAFTFTEKAAAELKERIRVRVTARVGVAATDKLGQLQVGTIHAYCFRLLQTYIPHFETYSLIDENQLVSMMVREGGPKNLNLKRFDPRPKPGLFRGIERFLQSVDVVENELLSPDDLPDDEFRETLGRYYAMLERYRLLTFGLQIVRAVEALEDPGTHVAVTGGLQHLIVDEYQDVNPAQEKFISLLAKPTGGAHLVVVGDDDQAIYQWRGSNVSNIVTFEDRYAGVKQFHLLTNRRSRPGIIDLANSFAATIPGRLDKTMLPSKEAEGPSIDLAIGFDDEAQEAEMLALSIQKLHGDGVAYRSMAVLVRARTAYPRIMDAFTTHGVPVQPGGRTGLFQQEIAAVLGATYAWLNDVQWSPGRWVKREDIDLDELVSSYLSAFDIGSTAGPTLRDHLLSWKIRVPLDTHDVNLIGELYELLSLAGVGEWDTDDQDARNRLGTIARFTNVLADYETVTRRSRTDPLNPGEQVGGVGRGEWYYKNLAILMVNYANGSYDDFDGEEDAVTDAVDLGTIHGAKGLEWPIVFLPSLTDGRFPSSRTGNPVDWLVPTELFDHARYEGSDADERRLFYVALTRAKDWVSLSSHLRVNKVQRKPSPYLTHCAAHVVENGLPTITAGAIGHESPDLAVTYSELAAYMECPQSFLLRNRLGFMPPVAAELGYGNAVHHLMRAIAERTKSRGKLPTPREINQLLVTDFYLPFANKPAHKEMKERARQLVFKYVNDHPGDLLRTWATERPFELYLDGVVISGRADVIYDDHDGVPDNLAIVDYKTSTGGRVEPLQLQVYADAGRREGLTVGAAFVLDMGQATRHDVALSDADIAAAETLVIATAESLKARDFTPAPAKDKCRRCDVKLMCKAAML